MRTPEARHTNPFALKQICEAGHRAKRTVGATLWYHRPAHDVYSVHMQSRCPLTQPFSNQSYAKLEIYNISKKKPAPTRRRGLYPREIREAAGDTTKRACGVDSPGAGFGVYILIEFPQPRESVLGAAASWSWRYLLSK